MGDPRRIRSTLQTPMHPWERARIEEEKILTKEYGFKNKREIWKMNSILKQFTSQAKRLTVQQGAQADKERKQLLTRLTRYGLLPADASLDSVLNLTLRNILDRRLQTLVFKKGLARTTTQARQFITHRHIIIGGKKVTSPSYLVPVAEESQIAFVARSTLADEEHPERAVKKQFPGKPEEEKSAKKEVKEEKKEEKKEAEKKSEKKTAEKKEQPKESKDVKASEEKPSEEAKE